MKQNCQPVNRFVSQCISDMLDGLRDGLSHFSGPSRAAVIFCLTPESPICICDPQNLLHGHETRLRLKDGWSTRHYGCRTILPMDANFTPAFPALFSGNMQRTRSWTRLSMK